MQRFRKTFQILDKEKIHWFPGHMGKGLKQMQQKLKTVDCIIEVHDCRIPLSGRNEDFRHTVSGLKPHILVLNKKDLVDRKLHPRIINTIRETGNGPENDNVILTNCKDHKCDGIKKIIPLAIDLIRNSNRFNRSEEQENSLMIIGVPNIGKSSLINSLRNRHLKQRAAAPVGGVAGVTRSVLTRIKICEDPLIYLLDTPGILMPHIKNVEVGMKLALCSCFQDHLVGEENIADFLLYWMNKSENFRYVEAMGLEAPSDEISEVLIKGATKLNKTIRSRNFDNTMVLRPDLLSAARFMIQSFRTGAFGKICLDHEALINR